MQISTLIRPLYGIANMNVELLDSCVTERQQGHMYLFPEDSVFLFQVFSTGALS